METLRELAAILRSVPARGDYAEKLPEAVHLMLLELDGSNMFPTEEETWSKVYYVTKVLYWYLRVCADINIDLAQVEHALKSLITIDMEESTISDQLHVMPPVVTNTDNVGEEEE